MTVRRIECARAVALKRPLLAVPANAIAQIRTYATAPPTSAAHNEQGTDPPGDMFSYFTPNTDSPSSLFLRHEKLVAFLDQYRVNPPRSNLVWSAYLDFKEAVEKEDATSTEAAPALSRNQYKTLLRCLNPGSANKAHLTRSHMVYNEGLQRWLNVASGVSDPDIAVCVPMPCRLPLEEALEGYALSSVQGYMLRVHTVLEDMRRFSKKHPMENPVPTLQDFNHVLGCLAPGGHLGSMNAIWEQMSSAGIKANLLSFRLLLIGLTRHAARQIDRIQVREARRIFAMRGRGIGKKLKNSLLKSAEKGHLGRVPLAPNARAAATLAALRALALLKYVETERPQDARKYSNLIARAFRTAGQLADLKPFLKQTCNIDLSSPDSAHDVAESGILGTEMINTIIMTLGEQATVPEMIAAYDSLVRPLPRPVPEPVTFFATSLPDTFADSTTEAGPCSSNGSSDPLDMFQSVYPSHHFNCEDRNSTTFKSLIKYCCTALDPVRNPIPLPGRGSETSLNSLAARKETLQGLAHSAATQAMTELLGGWRRDENKKRRNGTYDMFAWALIHEGLELSDSALYELADGLGIDVVNKQDITESRELDANALKEKKLQEIMQFMETASTAMIPEYYASDAVAIRASDPSYVPVIGPFNFAVTSRMLDPFYSNLSQRMHIPPLMRLKDVVSKALLNKATEMKVLQAAMRVYEPRLKQSRDEHQAFCQKYPNSDPFVYKVRGFTRKPTHAQEDLKWTSKWQFGEAEELQEVDVLPEPIMNGTDQYTGALSPGITTEADKRELATRKLHLMEVLFDRLKEQLLIADTQAAELEALLYEKLYPRVKHLHSLNLARAERKRQRQLQAQLDQENQVQEEQAMEEARQSRLALERQAKKLLNQSDPDNVDQLLPT